MAWGKRGGVPVRDDLHLAARSAQRTAERASHGSEAGFRAAMSRALAAMNTCGCPSCRREAGEWGSPVQERCFDCGRVVAPEGSLLSAGVVTEQDGAIRCRPCHSHFS